MDHGVLIQGRLCRTGALLLRSFFREFQYPGTSEKQKKIGKILAKTEIHYALCYQATMQWMRNASGADCEAATTL